MTAAGKIHPAFDAEKARADFPILSRQVYGKRLVYLDSGASAEELDTMLVCDLTEKYIEINASYRT